MTDKQRKRLYRSHFWKKKSLYQRKKQPLCEVCLKQNPPVFTPAVAADHIEPFTDKYSFSQGKLQSICGQHHREKSAVIDHPKSHHARITEFRFFNDAVSL